MSSAAAYGVTLYDPTSTPVDFDEVPDSFTAEYFASKFREKWLQGTISDLSEGDASIWTIPELDSGDTDNVYSGLLSYEDRGIALPLSPHATVVEFVQWIRSIVPYRNVVYLVKVPELVETLNITQMTSDDEILEFLNHR